MKWHIVTDSSCDMLRLDTPTKDVIFSSVPFYIHLDAQEYADVPELDIGRFVTAMERSGESHTSCPPPSAWFEAFCQTDETIAITISAQLSGSYSSANTARQMVLDRYPDKKIALIDSCSTGPKVALVARHIDHLVRTQPQMPFEDVVRSAEAYCRGLHTYFTLSSFGNLVKSGRISRIAGFIASKLNIRVIGAGSAEGKIVLKDKIRGEKKALTALLKTMTDNHFNGGPVAISHCLNEELAEELARQIHETWKKAQVLLFPTRGLCSFYAERNGLILSY